MLSGTRIAVLVSGGGTNLQALIDDGIEIAVVISSREGVCALDRARNARIEALTIAKKGRSQQEFEAELLGALRERRIGLIVLAGFLSILSAEFVNEYQGRIVNVHPSLIPSFCGEGFYGLRVHEAALGCGVKLTGATVHLVNEVPDGGRILMQKAVEIQEGDTPEILQQRVMREAEWVLLPKAVRMLAQQLAQQQ